MEDSPWLPSERELFDRAMDLPGGADLATFLDEATSGNRELADRVAVLVSSLSESERLLPDLPEEPAGIEKPGQLIGNYRLEEMIGDGAFGEVWRAEQLEPVQRQVAVKILKLGLDTESVVRRFELERQALAMMDHPNIANVYDAGATAAGRSYFVMEYLDGEPLFTYADSCKLTIGQRLDLMEQIVEAVRHAHQKGIIHRDLKSTNILVVEIDGKALPKVIDFGIAKLIAPPSDAERTLTPGSWGTPAYMSPEQLAGDPVDTRSDIFSLGIILYRLLSGSTAPRGDSGRGPSLSPSRRLMQLNPGQQQKAAAARSTTPHNLARILKGELDWIVLRAAADEPGQRYESAEALCKDFSLFRAGRPVVAGPPTKCYVVVKFIRRYRGRLAVAALGVCALMAATVVSLIFARKAQEASKAMEGALYQAHLAEANAVRQSGRVGQRTQALAAIAAAAKINPTPELRNEAIAAMALPDLELLGTLDAIPEQNAVHAYDFVSDLLLTARRDSREILRYHIQTGETLEPIRLPWSLYTVDKLYVSPGGTVIAVYGNPRFQLLGFPLTFYEVETGRKICHVSGANYHSHGCLFLNSARVALVPMVAGGLAEIDLETGKERRLIKTAGKVNHISTNAAETRLVACLWDAGKIQLIDAASGAVTKTISRPGETLIEAVRSPNGRLLAYGGGEGMVRCQNLTRKASPPIELAGHRSMVTRISFVLGGDYLVTSSWDNTARLWNATGSQSLSLEGAVRVSRDGERILVYHGKRVRLFRLMPSREVTICSEQVPTKSPGMAFSPDSSRAAICNEEGTLLVALPGARVLASFGSRHRAASFDPDGKTLATTGKDGLRIWDLDALTEAPDALTRHAPTGHSTVFDSIFRTSLARNKGNTLLAAASLSLNPESSRRIRILDLATGATRASLRWKGADTTSLVFDPHGRWLAASYWRGDGFTVWSTERWKQIANPAKGVAFMKIAVNYDGSLVASGSPSEICLWDTLTWECVRRFSCEVPSAISKPVDFSPDGRLLACGYDSAQIQLRRVSDGAEIARLTLPIGERYKRLKFSPDGRFLGVLDQERAFFFDLEAIEKHLDLLGLGMEKR